MTGRLKPAPTLPQHRSQNPSQPEAAQKRCRGKQLVLVFHRASGDTAITKLQVLEPLGRRVCRLDNLAPGHPFRLVVQSGLPVRLLEERAMAGQRPRADSVAVPLGVLKPVTAW